jgi:hypothetical protein
MPQQLWGIFRLQRKTGSESPSLSQFDWIKSGSSDLDPAEAERQVREIADEVRESSDRPPGSVVHWFCSDSALFVLNFLEGHLAGLEPAERGGLRFSALEVIARAFDSLDRSPS